jgi:hypothetical protein
MHAAGSSPPRVIASAERTTPIPRGARLISSGCEGGVREGNRFRSIRVRRRPDWRLDIGFVAAKNIGVANPGRSDQGSGLLGAFGGRRRIRNLLLL